MKAMSNIESNNTGILTTSTNAGALAGRVPEGTISFFASTVAPAGWMACDGAYVSATEYPRLCAVIGTTYGARHADGRYKLPDMRGLFPRGVNTSTDERGFDAGRQIGSVQNDAIRNLTARFRGMIFDGYWQDDMPNGVIKMGTDFSNRACGNIPKYNPTTHGYIMDASRQVPTASENRPVNIALLAMIKCDEAESSNPDPGTDPEPEIPGEGFELYHEPFIQEFGGEDEMYDLKFEQRASGLVRSGGNENSLKILEFHEKNFYSGSGINVSIEIPKEENSYPIINTDVMLDLLDYNLKIGITPKPEFLTQELQAKTGFATFSAFHNIQTGSMQATAKTEFADTGLSFKGTFDKDGRHSAEFRLVDRSNQWFETVLTRTMERKCTFTARVDVGRMLDLPAHTKFTAAISGDIEGARDLIRRGLVNPVFTLTFTYYF